MPGASVQVGWAAVSDVKQPVTVGFCVSTPVVGLRSNTVIVTPDETYTFAPSGLITIPFGGPSERTPPHAELSPMQARCDSAPVPGLRSKSRIVLDSCAMPYACAPPGATATFHSPSAALLTAHAPPEPLRLTQACGIGRHGSAADATPAHTSSASTAAHVARHPCPINPRTTTSLPFIPARVANRGASRASRPNRQV